MFFPDKKMGLRMRQQERENKKNNQVQSTTATHPKRASFSASFSGSMTLEAALAFPLFLFFIYAILTIGNILVTQAQFREAMTETVRYAAKYIPLAEEGDVKEDPEKNAEISDGQMAEEDAEQKNRKSSKGLHMILQGKLRGYLDQNRMYLVKTGQFRLTKCDWDMQRHEITLKANAHCQIPIPFFGNYQYCYIQQVCQKTFSGYVSENELSQSAYVYVTEYGNVYHTNRNCSHIAIRVVKATAGNCRGKRNCRHCGKKKWKIGDYVTISGDCIHGDFNCSGLKRTVRMVRKEELKKLPLCSRCGGAN